MSDEQGPPGGATGGQQDRDLSPLDRLRKIEVPPPTSESQKDQGPLGGASAAPPEPVQPPPAIFALGDRPEPYVAKPDAEKAAVAPRRETVKKQGSIWRELPVLLAIAIVLAVLIKTFLVQAFFIPSGSMEQTLQIHDRVLVNKLAFHTGSPRRGDIVVFNTTGTLFADSDPEYAPCPRSNALVSSVRVVERFVGLGTCGENDFIKRIIAIPGDKIEGMANGPVVVNGHALDEPYVYQDNHSAFCEATLRTSTSPEHTYDPSSCDSDPQPIVVPKGMYWVMGDHRGDSDDSRFNGFVPGNKIVGRAFVRILPVSRFGFLHVPDTFKGVGNSTAAVASVPAVAAPGLLLPLVGVRLMRRRSPRRRPHS